MLAFQKIVITFTTILVICVFRLQHLLKFFIQVFLYFPFCRIPVEHSFWVMMQLPATVYLFKMTNIY